MKPIFCLIHSPLVGPFTWAPVAAELKRRDEDVILPDLHSGVADPRPYWERHASAVADAIRRSCLDRPVLLVAHSGAGLLLPAVRKFSSCRIAAYIFVDAGIPEGSKSRLELLYQELPEIASQSETQLRNGERLPQWKDKDFEQIIPDQDVRRAVLTELHPQPLEFYLEAMPLIQGWPDAPCGYLQFSPAYNYSGRLAQRNNWAYREIPGGHFHMLVDPPAVVQALVELAQNLLEGTSEGLRKNGSTRSEPS